MDVKVQKMVHVQKRKTIGIESGMEGPSVKWMRRLPSSHHSPAMIHGLKSTNMAMPFILIPTLNSSTMTFTLASSP